MTSFTFHSVSHYTKKYSISIKYRFFSLSAGRWYFNTTKYINDWFNKNSIKSQFTFCILITRPRWKSQIIYDTRSSSLINLLEKRTSNQIKFCCTWTKMTKLFVSSFIYLYFKVNNWAITSIRKYYWAEYVDCHRNGFVGLSQCSQLNVIHEVIFFLRLVAGSQFYC